MEEVVTIDLTKEYREPITIDELREYGLVHTVQDVIDLNIGSSKNRAELKALDPNLLFYLLETETGTKSCTVPPEEILRQYNQNFFEWHAPAGFNRGKLT